MEAENFLEPGYHTAGLSICNVCRSIPFDQLPSEDEAAYPHQPSIVVLEESAKTCPLCALLLRSVRELEDCGEHKQGEGQFLGGVAVEAWEGGSNQPMM